MNIGIVTTWFERGAAIVSKQFEEILSKKHNIYIYARGGEKYAVGDLKWDRENVTWAKKVYSPFNVTIINKTDFNNWLDSNKIDLVIFNEQHWWMPLIWCDEKKIPTIAYIDYYKKNTIPLFASYTALICNTKRHFSVFNWHMNAFFMPWGTDISVFKPTSDDFSLVSKNQVTFFHSSGLAPLRKGTDILIRAAAQLKQQFKLIIHTQVDIIKIFPELKDDIEFLLHNNKLVVINKTISAPGLYHLGDVYIYPSRLDGIGLTIAEAIACGLIPVVSNNAPMNEFVSKESGYVIDISDYNSREDGYYWPECTPSVNSLVSIMSILCNNIHEIPKIKELNYNFAVKKLNWAKNSEQIYDLIDRTTYTPLSESTKNKILIFESSGILSFNKMWIKYSWIINPFYNLALKISLFIKKKKENK